MNTIMNTALGGMQRHERGAETAAQNIANLNTPGYRSQRYDPITDTVVFRNADEAPDVDADPETPPPSDVDLATELVDLKTNEIGYRANAIVLGVADRMADELLDILA